MRSLDMNPVYQSMKIALSQADAQLAEVRGQIGAQEQAIGNLRSRMDAIPEVEAELARLNRDYAGQQGAVRPAAAEARSRPASRSAPTRAPRTSSSA